VSNDFLALRLFCFNIPKHGRQTYISNYMWTAANFITEGRMRPHGSRSCTVGLDGLHIFHSKNVGEPIEYRRCLPLPSFNKFVLTQKNL